jgi:glycosyltransferase involved in cell wall biosynthesis
MSIERPLITIAIPVHNGEKYIGEAIESALAQSYRPIEVVVVDDGSTDASLEIASSFEGVTVHHQEQGGPSAARNQGLRMAAGDLITFIDADDQMTGDGLLTQYGHLLSNPHLECVFGYADTKLEPGTRLPSWLKVPEGHDSVVPFPSALFQTATLRRVGGFDETVRVGEWFELFTRLREGNFEVAVVPFEVIHKRVHSANLSHQQEAMQAEMFRSLKKRMDRQRNRQDGGSEAR